MAALGALIATAAAISIGTSGAYFTGATSAEGTAGSGTGAVSSTWAPVAVTATKAGSPSGAQSSVVYGDAAELAWAKSSSMAKDDFGYRLERNTVNDFSERGGATDITAQIAAPAYNSTAKTYTAQDTTTEPAVSASSITQIAGTQRQDGNFAIIAGKVYYWGKVTKQDDAANVWFGDVLTPTELVGTASGDATTGWGSEVVQIAAGRDHMCGLTVLGEVKCVGFNGFGQLGRNNRTDSTTVRPITDTNAVFTGKTIISIDAGEYYTCALTSDGTVGCWGDNQFGQLGNKALAGATNSASTVPVLVSTAASATEGAWASTPNKPVMLTTGAYHACVVKGSAKAADGSLVPPNASETVACWGFNNWKQLGKTPAVNARVNTPVNIQDSTDGLLGGITRISAGHAVTCVINDRTSALDLTTTNDLTDTVPVPNVACWGGGGLGVLGNGAAAEFDVPTTIKTSYAGAREVTGYTAIDVNTTHACAATPQVFTCWGQNFNGQMGNGVSSAGTGLFSPASREISPALGAGTITSISTSWTNSCVVNEAGNAACWGFNGANAQARTTGDLASPAPVWLTSTQMMRPPVLANSMSAAFLAVATNGKVHTWGVSDPSYFNNTGAAEVTGFPYDVVQLTVGAAHICALSSQGVVYCAGKNNLGQLGDKTYTDRAAAVVISDTDGVFTGHPIKKIDAMEYGTCALSFDGTIGCWGDNGAAQLGLAPGTPNNLPYRNFPRVLKTSAGSSFPTTDIASRTTQPIDISMGSDHGCAMKKAGVACWGDRTEGQTGVAFGGYNPDPLAISDPTGILAGGTQSIDSGWRNTCVLVGAADAATGKAYCWGRGDWGALGDQAGADRIELKPVLTATTYRTISVGTQLSCGFTDRAAECWGNNNDGELGRGDFGTGPFAAGAVVDTNGVFKNGISSVAVGWESTCVSGTRGSISCWGYGAGNRNLQGNNSSLPTPTNVTARIGSMTASAQVKDQTWSCLAGAALVTGTATCTLAPDLKYYYRVTYTAGTSWVSADGIGQRS